MRRILPTPDRTMGETAKAFETNPRSGPHKRTRVECFVFPLQAALGAFLGGERRTSNENYLPHASFTDHLALELALLLEPGVRPGHHPRPSEG